jgi:hypothetical protein
MDLEKHVKAVSHAKDTAEFNKNESEKMYQEALGYLKSIIDDDEIADLADDDDDDDDDIIDKLVNKTRLCAFKSITHASTAAAAADAATDAFRLITGVDNTDANNDNELAGDASKQADKFSKDTITLANDAEHVAIVIKSKIKAQQNSREAIEANIEAQAAINSPDSVVNTAKAANTSRIYANMAVAAAASAENDSKYKFTNKNVIDAVQEAVEDAKEAMRNAAAAADAAKKAHELAKANADAQAKANADAQAKAKADAELNAKADAELKALADEYDEDVKAQERADAEARAAAAAKAVAEAKADAEARAAAAAKAVAEANTRNEQLYIKVLEYIKTEVIKTADHLDSIIQKPTIIPDITYNIGVNPTADLIAFINLVIFNPITLIHNGIVKTIPSYDKQISKEINDEIQVIKPQIDTTITMILDEGIQKRLQDLSIRKCQRILNKINNCSQDMPVSLTFNALIECYNKINERINRIPNDISKFDDILLHYRTIHDECIKYLNLFEKSKEIKNILEACNRETIGYRNQIPLIKSDFKKLIQQDMQIKMDKAIAEITNMSEDIRTPFQSNIAMGDDLIRQISLLLPDKSQ